MTLSDLEWLSKIFNHVNRRAVSETADSWASCFYNFWHMSLANIEKSEAEVRLMTSRGLSATAGLLVCAQWTWKVSLVSLCHGHLMRSLWLIWFWLFDSSLMRRQWSTLIQLTDRFWYWCCLLTGLTASRGNLSDDSYQKHSLFLLYRIVLMPTTHVPEISAENSYQKSVTINRHENRARYQNRHQKNSVRQTREKKVPISRGCVMGIRREHVHK